MFLSFDFKYHFLSKSKIVFLFLPLKNCILCNSRPNKENLELTELLFNISLEIYNFLRIYCFKNICQTGALSVIQI